MKEENYSITYYKERIEGLSVLQKKYKRIAQIWVTTRLITFLALAFFAYFAFPYTLISGGGLLIGIFFFLFQVRKSADNKEQLHFIERLIKLNENEIKASHFDFSNFPNGEEYINPQHPYSYDMDLFGKRGVFQILNRTVTKNGEKIFVKRLLNGIEKPSSSTQAIDELISKMDWCQEYLAYGSLLEEEAREQSISSLFTIEFQLKSWMKTASFLLPILAVILTISYYFNLINGFIFLLGAVVILLPIRNLLKTTHPIHTHFGKLEKRIQALLHQIDIFKEEEFTSPLLKDYWNTLFTKEQNAKNGLKRLEKLAKEFAYRNNILVAIFLNFFFAWDIRLLLNLKKWEEEFKSDVALWEDILYEMEGLISGAIYRNNYNEHTCIPTASNNGQIIIKEISHPIIPLNKVVKNNFSLNEKERYAIITGPNMAGKSTFLRCIGVNLILAKAGFHPLASHFEFPNIQLYSSMRNTDNLEEETSYFHAELLRLRFIVDAIEKGEKVFIILDEILKGTNSKDKKEGSALFLKKLNQLGSRGLIATHDLSLTELANEDEKIINKYFDTRIEGEDISFDYKIKDGVARNMNASFLLRKLKLIDGE